MTEFSRARRRTANYKSCFFRNCGNTTICASEKIFIPVPKGEVRKHWIQIVRGDDTRQFSLKSSLYCCEDHFDLQEDLENYTRLLLDPTANVRLKKGVLPKPCTVNYTRSNIYNENTEDVNLPHQFTSDDNTDMIFDEADRKPNIESIQLYRSIGIQTDYCIDEKFSTRRDIGTQTENNRRPQPSSSSPFL